MEHIASDIAEGPGDIVGDVTTQPLNLTQPLNVTTQPLHVAGDIAMAHGNVAGDVQGEAPGAPRTSLATSPRATAMSWAMLRDTPPLWCGIENAMKR